MKTKNILLTILAIGFVLRLILLFLFHGEPLHIIDEQHYAGIAQYLAQTGNFGVPTEHLVSIRPPMYVWLIAGVYKIIGIDNPELVFSAVRFIQILLSLATVVLVYLVGKKSLGNQTTALIAAGIVCFYPSLVIQNFMILTETLFTFWLTLTIYFSVCLLTDNKLTENNTVDNTDNKLTDNNTVDSESSSRKLYTSTIVNAVLCGLCLGCGALTRSILWLAIPCISVYLFCFVPGNWRKKIISAGLVGLVSIAVIAPWVIRNTRIQKTFTVIDCMSGRNLMMGNYEYTPLYRAWDAISIPPPNSWDLVLSRQDSHFLGLTQGQKDKAAGKYAKEYILAHPAQTAQRDVMKAFCFWQLERSATALLKQKILTRWIADSSSWIMPVGIFVSLYFVIVFLTALAGIIFTPPANWRINILFLCVIALFWGVHSLVFAHSRYHLPLIPLLSLYSGACIDRLIQSRFDIEISFRPRIVLCYIIGLIFTVFWMLEILWYFE